MSQHFDASAPASDDPAPEQLLRRMRGDQALSDLRRAMERIDDLVAQESERAAEEGLAPEIASLLDQISGADDAPLEFASLHRRVASGTLTWEQFWAQPQEQPGGMRLFQAVVQAQLAHVAGLAQERPPEDDPPG